MTSPAKKNVRMVSSLLGGQRNPATSRLHGSKLSAGRPQDQVDIPGLMSGQLQLQQALHAAHLASGEPMTAEALSSMGFLVHRAAGIHASVPTSTTKPVAIVGLESMASLRRALDLESSDARSEGHPSTSQACPPSDSAFSLERGRNKLFPIFVNGVAKQYFKISTIRDYAQVLRKLLRRDPLLTFALQKAIKHLRTGDCKTVSHVTSDPTASSASLYGLRITPCVWVDQDGISITALLLEHNVPYNPEDVMPRLLRDYAVLSHVPSMLTLIDFNGIVLYQNAASLDYMGDLSSLSLSIAALGHGGMLTLLFHHEPQHLDALLEEVLAGNYWQQVMQVPSSLKRQFHQSRMAIENDSTNSAGPNSRPHLSTSSKQLLVADELEPEFQIDSFTTQGARTKRGTMVGRPLARSQAALLQQFPSRNGSNQPSPLDGNSHPRGASQSPFHMPSSNSTAIPEDSEADSSMAMMIAGRSGFMSNSFTSGPVPTPISFTQPKNSGAQPNRRFMSLVAAAQPTQAGQSFTASIHSAPSEDQERGQSQSEVRAQLASAGTLGAECWHEVSAIPLLDPVLDKQVILLVQSNVSARVELENRLADLTDAQLGMLEQLFPRHVIEYMLSSKSNGSVARNLTQLANSHEMVMVLFTDVVGFTSMSKEVEPSQVMQFLNQLYTVFDDLVDEYDLYKLDTVGDCYIVVAGLIRQDEDGFACTVEDDTKEQRLFHADMMMSFAKAMLKDSKKVLMPHNNEPVSLRVGIHCGPLVSGLVGPKMPKFTLFGDTMNTASRLESTCKPGCVQVSDQFSKLVPHVEWKYMGEVEMKGKGLVETYLWIPSLIDSDDDSDGDSVDLSGVSKAMSMKSGTMRSRPFTGSTHRSAGRRQSMAASCVSDHNMEPLAAILKNIRGSQTGSRPGSPDSMDMMLDRGERLERLEQRDSYRNSDGSSKRSSTRGLPGLLTGTLSYN
ncbi:MAG: hypothetical protein WDW36_005540 [Sanguina aurantia]